MNKKHQAFTLLELMIAMTMLAVIILVISVTIGQFYFQQKKVTMRQNFHNEARFLTEKVVQMVRNNTIDYDRYFVEYGPDDGACPSFQNQKPGGAATQIQIPLDLQGDLGSWCPVLPIDCPGGCLYDFTGDDNPEHNLDNRDGTDDDDELRGRCNRETLGYETIFFWDTNNDNTPDRQLGGMTPSASEDPCTEAFTSLSGMEDLYLINGSRTIRTHVKYYGDEGDDDDGDGILCDDGECYIALSREFGQDIDGDSRADSWSIDCNDSTTLGLPAAVATDEGQIYCQRAQNEVTITPNFLSIIDAKFLPGPTRDPYLASRIDDTQIQPHAFIDMSFEIRDPGKYRFTDSFPNTRLQTSASSRVFGNTRY